MYQLILWLHIGSLCLAGVGILYADTSALGWLLGKHATIDKRAVFVSHWIVTLGLAGLLLTGSYLFWPMRNYLITSPLFLTKIAFVIALVINSFIIERLILIAEIRPFRTLTLTKQIEFFVSGAVSTASWAGAFILALVIFS